MSPELVLSRAEDETEILRSQNKELKEAIQQARARICSKLEKHQAANFALKTDHEELKGLCQEAQSLTKRWQQIWDDRKKTGAHTEAEEEELRQLRQMLRDRISQMQSRQGVHSGGDKAVTSWPLPRLR
eukprot:symbB.v1.2.004228.t1/scaffold221.1/size262466/12